MIVSLSIKNYALIDSLEVQFEKGFSIITGETGAGKSILLGGLALILGKRADLSSLKDKEKKCIIEGEFAIEGYQLEHFFKENDLDYEKITTLRRSILPNGKSRAFINDTPVNLTVLSALGELLIDIHSQHQTLQLAIPTFQFKIIDALANTEAQIREYKTELKIYQTSCQSLDDLLTQRNEATAQYDYHSFLYKELKEANFRVGEQEKIEQQLESLNHVGEVKSLLDQAQKLAELEEFGLEDGLSKFEQIIVKLAEYNPDFQDVSSRVSGVKIEFSDLQKELQHKLEEVEHSPSEIDQYNDRLALLYNLYKKHGVSTIEELTEITEAIAIKVDIVEEGQEQIENIERKIKNLAEKLNDIAQIIHQKRAKAIPDFTQQLEGHLARLEMPHTRFRIGLQHNDQYLSNGKDELNFEVSTNKGAHFEPLKKVASGGEMSRIMLAVKLILSKYAQLPSIIFDEIDTGVSGEVSNKIANIMADMSKHMQVLAITHLPQIAASGSHHYKVFKTVSQGVAETKISRLNKEERVLEVAEMLSGKKVVDTAITHAKQLLNQ